MSTSLLKKLLHKHSKPVEKLVPPIPIAAEKLQKIAGVAAKTVAPAIGRALGAGARAAKPHVAEAGKSMADTAAFAAGSEIGRAASKKAGMKPASTPSTPPVAKQTKVNKGVVYGGGLTGKVSDSVTGAFGKQSPDVAARMWQRGLVWDGNKHRWVKRPQTTHEDAPTQGKSYQGNVIVIPKDKSFWGSGATYGETEKASKTLASMLEHKFPGSTVVFGKKPIIEGEHKTEIDSWIERNWKKAVSRRRGRKGAFDKSAISDGIRDSRISRTGHYSDKEKEQRKKDSKFWEEKNLEYLRQHPDKRDGR